MHGNISEFQKRDKDEHNKIRIISFHQISTIFHVIPDFKIKPDMHRMRVLKGKSHI